MIAPSIDFLYMLTFPLLITCKTIISSKKDCPPVQKWPIVKWNCSVSVYVVANVVGFVAVTVYWSEQNRTELSRACLGLYALPKESQPAPTVRSAPTRGDTLDKLNSDKSACQYDLNHGRYFLSTSCHISAPAGLILSATWLEKKQWMMKEWEVSVTGLTRGRKGTSFD